ncbi:MAG: TolC family protein [Deltaproteobacteria bacterium]|nr:TolC family protein [Deltaproteobacteria bacterium]
MTLSSAPWLLLVGQATFGTPMSFDQALGLAEAHPTLAAQDAALQAREAREADLSAVTQNPTLQILPGWRLPNSDDPGFEIQMQLTQQLDLGGWAGRRRDAARAERQTLAAGRRAAALAQRMEAARAWFQLWRYEAELSALDEEAELARALATRLRTAVEAGAALAADGVEADIFFEEVATHRLDAEGLRFDAAMGLVAALGQDGAQLPATAGGPPQVQIPEEQAWPALAARAQDLPDAAHRALAARAAEARRAEVAASHSTKLTPTLYAQMERPQDVLLFAGVSVQLPLFDKGERDRGLAEAEAITARAEARDAAVTAGRTLRQALHEVEHTREVEQHVRAHVLPKVEQWVALTQRRFDAGETELMPVVAARRRLVAERIRLIELEEERRWSEVKAWLLLATTLSAAEAKE